MKSDKLPSNSVCPLTPFFVCWGCLGSWAAGQVCAAASNPQSLPIPPRKKRLRPSPLRRGEYQPSVDSASHKDHLARRESTCPSTFGLKADSCMEVWTVEWVRDPSLFPAAPSPSRYLKISRHPGYLPRNPSRQATEIVEHRPHGWYSVAEVLRITCLSFYFPSRHSRAGRATASWSDLRH